jgi:hypothetical protein
MKRRGWHLKEEEFLIDNYAIMTIKELKEGLEELANRDRSELLPKIVRTPDSINAKIKRLKAEGKIEGQKDEKTVHRSLVQRWKDYDRKPGESM